MVVLVVEQVLAIDHLEVVVTQEAEEMEENLELVAEGHIIMEPTN
jgi:hypothetical protein